MSEAPLAPKCRHCGVTNDTGASACWRCRRRDWLEKAEIPSVKSPRGSGQRSTFIGCMAYLVMILIGAVGLAFRAGPVVGLVVLLLSMIVLAFAIALLSLCTAMASI